MQRYSIYCLMAAVFGLIAMGLVVLSSTGGYADQSKGDSYYYVWRQLASLGVGGVLCLLAAVIDYRWWKRFAWVFLLGCCVLLVLCFIPGIGGEINGAHRWVRFGGFTFQPSELARLGVICFLAYWFTKYEHLSHTFLKGFILPGLIVGGCLVLIVIEVDIGATMLIGTAMAGIMFLAGTRWIYLITVVLIGCMILGMGLYLVPERMDRFLAFLDLENEKHSQNEGYQQAQGLIALGSGGVDGLGLGNGRQKMLYLTYAHTDFIFPIIGEELGMKWTLLVVFLYLLLFISGLCIVMNAKDRFGMLMGFGIIVAIALQAIVNLGVTTALLPNKGMPLPFVSYGGSNLMMCLLGVGILINVYRKGKPAEDEKPEIFAYQPGQRRRRGVEA